MASARLGSEVKTAGQAWREFRSHRSPRIIATGIVAAVAARVLLGGPLGWRDAAACAVMLAVYPFGEWAIHVHLLHLRPFRWRGRRIDLITARSHRQHHERPDRLGLILFGRWEALAVLVIAVPLVALPAGLLLGGGAALTGIVTGYALVGLYEWTHFLIHTAHRPKTALYRAIWRNHRLHHFKNEHYWHGITSTIADGVLGTKPDHREVPRSATARTLAER
jgi:hypothetical protein